LLLAEKKLPEKYRDHSLGGDYDGMRECHVLPDVLLVYSIDEKCRILYLERIGSHSELF
jgi:mRNA interferase YafQ